jgi:hypothetical protein
MRIEKGQVAVVTGGTSGADVCVDADLDALADATVERVFV